MESDELSREVNRLYWESGAPVTRLAAQLGVSRGTFYNHLSPRPAGADCPSCGGALEFATRSDRDNGNARCADCGTEQNVNASAEPDQPHHPRALPATGAGLSREATLLADRSAWIGVPDDAEDRLRTQLLIVAVGAAALGLGLLYVSRRK